MVIRALRYPLPQSRRRRSAEPCLTWFPKRLPYSSTTYPLPPSFAPPFRLPNPPPPPPTHRPNPPPSTHLILASLNSFSRPPPLSLFPPRPLLQISAHSPLPRLLPSSPLPLTPLVHHPTTPRAPIRPLRPFPPPTYAPPHPPAPIFPAPLTPPTLQHPPPLSHPFPPLHSPFLTYFPPPASPFLPLPHHLTLSFFEPTTPPVRPKLRPLSARALSLPLLVPPFAPRAFFHLDPSSSLGSPLVGLCSTSGPFSISVPSWSWVSTDSVCVWLVQSFPGRPPLHFEPIIDFPRLLYPPAHVLNAVLLLTQLAFLPPLFQCPRNFFVFAVLRIVKIQ